MNKIRLKSNNKVDRFVILPGQACLGYKQPVILVGYSAYRKTFAEDGMVIRKRVSSPGLLSNTQAK